MPLKFTIERDRYEICNDKPFYFICGPRMGTCTKDIGLSTRIRNKVPYGSNQRVKKNVKLRGGDTNYKGGKDCSRSTQLVYHTHQMLVISVKSP